jgi:hypothetical protein
MQTVWIELLKRCNVAGSAADDIAAVGTVAIFFPGRLTCSRRRQSQRRDGYQVNSALSPLDFDEDKCCKISLSLNPILKTLLLTLMRAKMELHTFSSFKHELKKD